MSKNYQIHKDLDLLRKLSELGVSFVGEAAGVREFKLDSNGLKVLVVENHSAPVVTSMVVYRVGSRNEAVGHTGSTHFLEHMMFKGTVVNNPADDRGIDDLLKPIGAEYNATTSYDRTNYFETVASEHLELVLSIEADRMRNLVLKKEDRDSEMTVVRNEFERGENSPTGVMYKELMAVAFREHPYHHPVIGWRSDVEGVPMEKMKEFYDTFYWPNNATVIVAGDVTVLDALSHVVKHFGSISSSPAPIPEVYTVEPEQEGERRFTVNRVGNDMPQVWMGFHVPQATDEDTYPLAVAAALLGNSSKRSSRLYKALVETGLAVSTSAWSGENRDPGLFMVQATCAPGVSPEKVEEAIIKELDSLSARTPKDRELWLVKSANRKSTALQRDDSSKFAQLLCSGESCADWRWSMSYDDRFDAVTPESVSRVAATYFTSKNRTVGYFVPEAPVVEKKNDTAGNAGFASRVRRHVLDNGLTVIAMATPGTGTAALFGSVAAGESFAPQGKALVPELVAYLLPRGSVGASKTEVAEQLDEMGTSLSFRTGTFETSFGTTVVTRDLADLLELFGEVVRNPLFDKSELDRSLREFTAFIQDNSSNTSRVASNGLSRELYEPGSAYYDPDFKELVAQMANIERSDLEKFHQEHYNPASTVLTIVGDIDADNVLELLPQSLKTWEGGARKSIVVDGVRDVQAPRRLFLPVPGKASADILIGLACPVKRTAADYFAARLANAALGRDTLSSRLGLVVRERNGLTYGIYSRFDNVQAGNAPWTIGLSVNPENVERALALVEEVVDEYRRNGITEKELADEKGRAYGEFAVSLRSSSGLARALLGVETVGLDASSIDALKASYDSVTVEEVNEAIRRYFDLSRAVTVVAGPERPAH